MVACAIVDCQHNKILKGIIKVDNDDDDGDYDLVMIKRKMFVGEVIQWCDWECDSVHSNGRASPWKTRMRSRHLGEQQQSKQVSHIAIVSISGIVMNEFLIFIKKHE